MGGKGGAAGPSGNALGRPRRALGPGGEFGVCPPCHGSRGQLSAQEGYILMYESLLCGELSQIWKQG